MKEIKCVQGSDIWWGVKRGIPSASNFSRILVANPCFRLMQDGELLSTHRTELAAIKAMEKAAKKYNGSWSIVEETPLSSSCEEYIAELIGDLANQSPNFFTSRGTEAMRNGQTTEPEARRWFELTQNVTVREIGCCFTDDERFCASPDGLIDPDEGLELKCPGNKAHALWLLAGGLPNEHKQQVHGNLWVTGRKRWWFMSYSPPLKPLLVAVNRDDYTERLGEALEAFWERFQSTRQRIYPLTPTEAAVNAWKDFLKSATLEELNASLVNLTPMKYEVKAAVWELLKRHAGWKGWVFNEAEKTFGKGF